jgi:lambda repressor-like predicted transcriptional regulator
MPDSVYNLCRQRGMSVAQLSEQSGLSHNRIMAIVLGRWTPNAAHEHC